MIKGNMSQRNREKEEQDLTPITPVETVTDTPEEKEESNIVHVIKSRGMLSGFLVA